MGTQSLLLLVWCKSTTREHVIITLNPVTISTVIFSLTWLWYLRRAIGKANCFHDKGHHADCTLSSYPYMAAFGIIQIILSQIPNFHKLSFLSIMAAVMSFTYATIGIGLAMATVAGA